MRTKKLIIPVTTLLSLSSATALAGVEVPTDGPCCYGTPGWESPVDMPLVDQNGTAYVYDPNSTLLAGTCASSTAAGGYVFGVTDISDQANAVIGSDWGLSTVNISPAANEAPMFHHPHWTRDYLGEVFGVAYGPDGAIYLTATEVYPNQGVNTGGEVWRIDPATGEPSLLVTLPHDPNSRVGLGNVAYDCAHDQLLVTNFFDGGIYRIDPNTGAILSAITHSELLTGMPANPGDIWSSNQPKLAVPWGIAVWGDYVYYGTWQNGAFPQVYAVRLDGAGDFIPATHELQLTEGDPGWDNYGGGVSPSDYNAVSDIAFKQGRMMIAERGQNALHTSWPHESRIYEWEYVGGSWTRTLDANLGPREFYIANSGSSSSGGTAYDYDGLVDPDAPDGRVWVTADCIRDPNSVAAPWSCKSYGAYAIQSDGNPGYFQTYTHDDHAIFIDYDRDQAGQDKQYVGDVELTCKAAPIDDVDCLSAVNEIIDCGTEDWQYDWQVSFTNDSNFPISTIIFTTDPLDPSVEVGENVGDNNTLNLPTPLAPGDSVNVNLGINAPNAVAGDQLCFDLKVQDEDEDFCCSEEEIEFCVTLPDCRECNNSIVGIKFYDENGNGVWDANEVPLPNWTINLLYPNGTSPSVVTDNSGAFVFDHIPAGTGYHLFETQQLGWTQTLPGGAPNGYHLDFTDPNGTTEILYFGNDKKIVIDPDLEPFEPLVVGPEDQDVAVLGFTVPGQATATKLRSVVIAINDQDPQHRLQALEVVADLDRDGEFDTLDPVLGRAQVSADSGLVKIDFAEPIELGTDDSAGLLVVADFGSATQDQAGAAAGVVSPWGPLGFGLALGLVILGAAAPISRRRRAVTWATAGASVVLGLAVNVACAPNREPEAPEAYRVGVVKVVATDANTGHYADVSGIEDAVSPWIVIED